MLTAFNTSKIKINHEQKEERWLKYVIFFLTASSFPDWSWKELLDLGGKHTAGWFWFGAEGTESGCLY